MSDKDLLPDELAARIRRGDRIFQALCGAVVIVVIAALAASLIWGAK